MPQGVFAQLEAQDVPQAVRLRFASALKDAANESGCWLWPMSTASHGYGQIGWGGKGGRGLVLAHRLSYVVFVGPIPEGMTVDHICRNRKCVNPLHLRLLSNVENAKDNGASRRTHCPHGHAYDGENTYVHPMTGHRTCRTCARRAKRAVA